jgi:hypothetical protein
MGREFALGGEKRKDRWLQGDDCWLHFRVGRNGAAYDARVGEEKWRVVSEESKRTGKTYTHLQRIRMSGLARRVELGKCGIGCHGPSTAWPVALITARKKTTGHFRRDDTAFLRCKDNSTERRRRMETDAGGSEFSRESGDVRKRWHESQRYIRAGGEKPKIARCNLQARRRG